MGDMQTFEREQLVKDCYVAAREEEEDRFGQA